MIETRTIGRFMLASGHGDRWQIDNRRHGEELGTVEWYQQWKCHIFVPVMGTVYSPDCLRDIAGFLEALKKERGA